MREHPLVLAYAGALIPALAMAFTQPVWSRVDEAQHADFIVQLSHGVYPQADVTLVDAETLRIMESTGVYRFEYPGTYPSPDLSDTGTPPPGISPPADAVWMSRHLWQLSYESTQTPGYYLLMVPEWWVAGHIGGTLFAIYVMRALNALLIASLAPMAWMVAVRVASGRLEVAFGAALFAALLPGLALNGTRVSNDGLAAVLGGATVVVAVRWAGEAWTWRRVAFIGLTAGAALLVKLTLFGLLPAVALAMLWPVDGSSMGHRLVKIAGAIGISCACLVPWLVLNDVLYGSVFRGARISRLTPTLPVPFSPKFIPVDALFFNISYWAGEPLGALPLAAGLIALGSLLLLIGAAGLIRLLFRKPIPEPALWVALASVVGVVAVALLLPATSGFQFAAPGRYAYPALPATAALAAVGMHSALPRAFVTRGLIGLYAVIAIGTLLSGAAGFSETVNAGSGAPPADSHVVAADASGNVGGVTVHIDRIAFDESNKATWIEVVAGNSGKAEAEWSATAVVVNGANSVTTDYMRSTHLPGDLDPGQLVTGWLYVPLDPATLGTAHSMQVRFPDIASDDYLTLGDLELRVGL